MLWAGAPLTKGLPLTEGVALWLQRVVLHAVLAVRHRVDAHGNTVGHAAEQDMGRVAL